MAHTLLDEPGLGVVQFHGGDRGPCVQINTELPALWVQLTVEQAARVHLALSKFLEDQGVTRDV